MEYLSINLLGWLISFLSIPFFILLLYSNKINNFYLDRAIFFYLFLINLIYWYWRLNYTLAPWSLNSAFSWIFFISETTLIYSYCFNGFILSSLNKKTKSVTREVTISFPKVDVFIPTYNESIELLEKTILCAKHIDYPDYQIWILDNGNRIALKELCQKYNIHYLERIEHINSKPGSLNNALNHTKALTNSEYILVIDSDFLCRKNIINRLLLPFHQTNQKIGIVQAPQYFYNADPLQNSFKAKETLAAENSFFYDFLSPGRNTLGIATCCGSPFIAKRAALELVEGFPTNTLTEDINLTYLLLQHDYITFFLQEEVAYGTAAESIGQFVSQNKRWAIGDIQQFFSKQGPFTVKRQSLLARMLFLGVIAIWLSYIFRILYLIAPGLNLFFSINVGFINDLSWVLFIPAYIATNFAFLYLKSKKTYIPLITHALHFVIAIPLLSAILGSMSKIKKLRVDVTKKEFAKKININYQVALPLVLCACFLLIGILYVVTSCVTFTCTIAGHALGIIWSIANILFIAFALRLAVDRGHGDDLWLTDHPVLVCQGDNAPINLTMIGLSQDWCRIKSEEKQFALGEKIKLMLDDCIELSGEIISVKKTRVELQLNIDDETKLKLFPFIFSEGRLKILKTSYPLLALKNLFR